MGFLSQFLNLLSGGPKVDYAEKIAAGAAVIDVRSPQEFKSGHAKKSVNIPLQNLRGKIDKYKNKEVIVVCRSGGRAMQAKSMFKAAGITCHNAGAWQNVNF